MNKIHVIGIGFRPIDKQGRNLLAHSEVVLVNERLLEVFRTYPEHEGVAKRIKILGDAGATIAYLREHRDAMEITVLAAGDPMFYGIGRLIVTEFGRDHVDICPDLSSMQVAFARIKEPWGEALLMSLHGGPDPKKRRKLEYEIPDIPQLLERHRIIGILTDRINNPSEIARVLSASPVTIYICERLGYPDEKITEAAPDQIEELSFAYPNIVIIRKKTDD